MKLLSTAFRLFFVMTVVTGIIYPFVITATAQTIFPDYANGSLIYQKGNCVGSKLLAQRFVSDRYFWSRPSAGEYSTVASSASNLGPTSLVLKEKIVEREVVFREKNGGAQTMLIPSEMLTSSGSGLDPHISPEAALLQVHRVAKVRNMEESLIRELVNEMTEDRQFGILGEKRVNVLQMNIKLDSL